MIGELGPSRVVREVVEVDAPSAAQHQLDAAQDRWHRIRGAELVLLVRAGASFIDDKLQERRRANGSIDDTDTGSVAA
jgi:hypothetical protein